MNPTLRTSRLADLDEAACRIESRLLRGDIHVDDGPRQRAITGWLDLDIRPARPGVAAKRRVASWRERGCVSQPYLFRAGARGGKGWRAVAFARLRARGALS